MSPQRTAIRCVLFSSCYNFHCGRRLNPTQPDPTLSNSHWCYACMYVWSSRSAEQGKTIFPCPRSRLRIWSRETDSAVPSRVSLLISILRVNLVLTYGIPPEFRGGARLFIKNRHTPSGQSRVYRVTQLRTDGARCRESAGTGPVNLKVVPNECCLGTVTMDQLICAFLSHTHYYWYEVVIAC